jgi:hypothetical protein
MNDKKIIEVLEMIAQDMKDDAKNFEGAPFNGRTVAEYFGNQGAAIAALANIVKSLIESRPAQHAGDERIPRLIQIIRRLFVFNQKKKMNTVPFNKKDVKAYLDRCIVHWRKKCETGDKMAEQYIDAFQSMRISLFGELLPQESSNDAYTRRRSR